MISEQSITIKQQWDYHTTHQTIYYNNEQDYVGSFTTHKLNNGAVKLESFYVADQYRGLGYGKEMMELFLEDNTAEYMLILQVNRNNKIAQQLYKSYGFTMVNNPLDNGNFIWMERVSSAVNCPSNDNRK